VTKFCYGCEDPAWKTLEPLAFRAVGWSRRVSKDCRLDGFDTHRLGRSKLVSEALRDVLVEKKGHGVQTHPFLSAVPIPFGMRIL
jgi:hypothetical protein